MADVLKRYESLNQGRDNLVRSKASVYRSDSQCSEDYIRNTIQGRQRLENFVHFVTQVLVIAARITKLFDYKEAQR